MMNYRLLNILNLPFKHLCGFSLSPTGRAGPASVADRHHSSVSISLPGVRSLPGQQGLV